MIIIVNWRYNTAPTKSKLRKPTYSEAHIILHDNHLVPEMQFQAAWNRKLTPNERDQFDIEEFIN